MKKLPVWEYSYLIHSPCQDVKIIYRALMHGAFGLFLGPKGRVGKREKTIRVTLLETPDAARWIKRFHRAVFFVHGLTVQFKKASGGPAGG